MNRSRGLSLRRRWSFIPTFTKSVALLPREVRTFSISLGKLRLEKPPPCRKLMRPVNDFSSIACQLEPRIAPASLEMTSPSAVFHNRYGPWAVVTGASSGIGAEFARQLAVKGLSLVLVARRVARLELLAGALQEKCGIQTRVVQADLTSEGGTQAVVHACEDIEVGLLVNNAGQEFHGSFFKTNAADHRNMIALNVTAVTTLAHAFGRKMCNRGRGGILFISSISAPGMPWLATYSSTKSFVTCLALTLRDELMRKGVDCMSLEPGLVVSEMTLGENEKSDGDHKGTLMPADFCVSEALRVFGHKAVFTPGFKNRLLKNVLLMLPRPTALWLLSEYLLTVMDPEALKY